MRCSGPGGASRLPSWPPVRRVAELGSFGECVRTMSILVSPLSRAQSIVAMCFFSPEADELALAKAFRAVAPHARPNEALVRIADASMQRRGRMHAAIADTGRGLSWPAMAEGVPFELPEVCQSPNKALHATAAAPGS